MIYEGNTIKRDDLGNMMEISREIYSECKPEKYSQAMYRFLQGWGMHNWSKVMRLLCTFKVLWCNSPKVSKCELIID